MHEIFLLMGEPAFIRSIFLKCQSHMYTCRSCFQKYLVFLKTEKEYWSKVHELMQTENELALTD